MHQRRGENGFSAVRIDPGPRLCHLSGLFYPVTASLSRLRSVIALVCLGAGGPALAGEPPLTLERPAWCPPPHAAAEAPPREVVERTRVESGAFSAPHGQPARFVDEVRLMQSDQLLETEELIYDPATGQVEIPVWLQYSDSLLEIEAARAWYDIEGERGRFEDVIYRLVGHDGSGSASSVELREPGQARLETFDFTTCDPEQPDWRIRAGRMHLDMEAGVGTARNARLDFKGVPLLYSPWMSFPLTDERKSGFLYPRLGYSGSDGMDVSVPWYWNIAPNQDATLTARWIQRRGAMLDTEYRFLTPRQRGQLDLEVLPDDSRADRTRYFGQFDYRARLAPRWSGRLDFRRASDDDYFIDLGSDLVDSAVQFLRSSATLSGRGHHWSLTVMADDFQVLDDSVGPEREPYRRLPRVQWNLERPLGGAWQLDAESELVHFDRDIGLTGTRLDIHPSLRYNLIRPGWFVRPRVGVRSTFYELSDAPTSSATRTTPIATADAGLIFERQTAGGRIQTLEPRLFYLWVPHRDQEELPVFDTRELTFGFSQLFHHNRFSGPDRQADANQLTLAVTSRVLDADDGSSRIEASLGQILFFRDQRVQLPGREETDRSRSATVAEMTWRPAQQLALSAGLQWDGEISETQVARFGLSYRGENSQRVALGYRFRRDRVDQADWRFRYPVSRSVSLIGRVTYSFEDSEALEVLGGLEYESCCWALRLTGRDFVRDRDGERRTAVFVELQLRGLGSLGRPPYELFRDQP